MQATRLRSRTFPSPGVLFRITGHSRTDPAFKKLVGSARATRAASTRPAGLESRLLSVPRGHRVGPGHADDPQAGKLPGRVIIVDYSLEVRQRPHGRSVSRSAGQRVLIIDNVLATGWHRVRQSISSISVVHSVEALAILMESTCSNVVTSSTA